MIAQDSSVARGAGKVYLDAGQLRAGDILLLHGGTAVSHAISTFHPGRFSHAALVVSQGQIFEADTDGIGWTELEPVCFGELDGRCLTVFTLPDPVDDLMVLRHVGLQKSPQSVVQQ